MCCGKVKQKKITYWGGAACGAFCLNFALSDMLQISCGTEKEIEDDIYKEIVFDSSHPLSKAKYSDPRKICKWVNDKMKTIKAELYVHSSAPTFKPLETFWVQAGLNKGDYTVGEGLTHLNTSGGKATSVSAICVFAHATGMHYVTVKKTKSGTVACDPYHGEFESCKDFKFSEMVITFPTNSPMRYTGVSVVLRT